MERGVYFDAWFPRQHCYHPSLPPRRLTMVDDLVDYRATTLVWAALGGGSLSLPYLEQEAFGEIDPRLRFYGFVNDAEFIAECHKRGIKVFGIVFEVQGWEFPAELNDEQDRVLALNELRGVGTPAWLGLREFGLNRYPRLWKPAGDYGLPAADFIEECVCRDIHGEPLHARWVEVPDNPHECYLMDRNHPLWREYLKAVIRIQIDAGVDGIQLDEAETPLTAMQYGGCFCDTCMTGFAEYLGREDFHYGQWLLEQHVEGLSPNVERNVEGLSPNVERNVEGLSPNTPLYWDYIAFQQRQITRYFGELADYAREYAASQGREVLVSGNFFNLNDGYLPLEPKVDLVITEMRNTTYRQPDWYRYAAGFARDKPVIVVENPYGGVVPELIDALGRGRAYDRFRMSLYEAAALGVNMSVPYGSWMGSVIQDAFYAPHELCVEIQSFLADHERLFSRETYHEVGVVYSVRSHSRLMAEREAGSDNRTNVVTDARQPYDVVFLPDGELRTDLPDVRRYRTLVAAGCDDLTEAQAALLREFEGREHDPQVVVDSDADFALCIHRVEDGAALHLIRYDYDEAADRVPPLPRLELDVRLPWTPSTATAFSPGGELKATLGERLVLEDVPLYGIVLLSP